jgi:hypothetical protein
VASWEDVERLGLALPGARAGVTRSGEPTVEVGRHPFARLRWDDEGRELLQYWSMDADSAAALADRSDTFVRVDTFAVKASIRARLDRLDEAEVRELLEESHRARRGVRG